ncbi:transcriptional regulator with PAS, ATPase and Fis domain [Caldalkalibacillus uzonensis]|uniref:HTH-type transcriptional regulatory protein TyrR n=1 Tax=Caldalkalibacillus uzonensis TaxID=353224 RepID=A0ABU0CYF7_9BACI|nr:sigma 54-interacting transcriptional regulator [Caldalkalibacillus uzonensis]MDQ0341180.1 transcriptional regulator with PAS, ATPase and Fis domain [Caldalkalibacillus uzonensis]
MKKFEIISTECPSDFHRYFHFEMISGLVVASKKMKEIMALANKISQVDSTVLLLGETGTGKEVVAKAIHENSSRNRTGAFIKVNCGAIPSELLESEFFGYAPGAYTGAKKEGKPGMFELAHNGTLFLDEVGEIPLHLQVKLLRILQDQCLTRVGGTTEIQVNVRIIAATNRNLELMVSQGKFREDLYYRLNVVPITIPPLRERKEDISPLIGYFLNKLNEKYQTNKSISISALEVMQQYTWPGNVRELTNMIERLVLTVNQDIIYKKHLPFGKNEDKSLKQKSLLLENANQSFSTNMFESVEKELIVTMLEQAGSIRKAAKKLGVSHTTLLRKMKKHKVRL